MLATLAGCVVIAALIGRWWALLLPVALIAAVLIAALSNWYYEGVPEDIQAGVLFGAFFGLMLGALALLVRQQIGRQRPQRRPSDLTM
jgi:hypothetical protein